MEKIIKNAIEMCKYANSKLDGVVKEDFNFRTEYTPYHHCDFRYIVKGNQKGACIEFGSHGGTYTRIFADKVTNYGGWIGGAEVFTFNEHNETWTNDRGESAGNYIFREDMIRAAMLKWTDIKFAIDAAVARENIIDNFQV